MLTVQEGRAGWRDGLTLRALVVGVLLAFGIGAAGLYLGHVVQCTGFGCGFYSAPMAHFVLFLLVGVVNVVLGAVNRSWALQRGELIVVYIMMALANSSHCMAHYWVPMLIGPFYYANPENDWANLIHPYFPEWVAPHNLQAIRLFFEGGHRGEGAIPWSVWLVPLASWLPLILALHMSTLCLTVILRRQWMERERLIYPLVHVPLAMIQEDGRGSLVRPFFRSGMMWAGFLIPVVLGCVQALHNYFPLVPTLRLSTSLALFRNTMSVPLTVSFATLGFFFLIKREVAFGLWVFSLFNILQRGFYGILGVGGKEEPALSVWNSNFPSLVHQSMGAMIVLVLGGLWVGREHLGQVARKAFGRATEVDDSEEILSYRSAVFGFLGSVGVLTVWLRLSGIPLAGILALLFFVFVVFVALTRVVVEGGVAVLYLPLVAPDAAVSALGSSTFGASGMVGMVFTRIWANETFTGFVMPHCAQGLKLSEKITGRRRWLFWAMLLAILAGLAGGIWAMLKMAYTDGAINLSRVHFIWLAQYVYDYAAARISDPIGPNWWGWFHTGIGALVMGALMLAQRCWLWWPLHPLGYPISSVFSWMMFNAFLAWLIKGVVLKYGGVRLYRAVRPFFLGLILGQFVIYGAFWIIDIFTGMVGNRLML